MMVLITLRLRQNVKLTILRLRFSLTNQHNMPLRYPSVILLLLLALAACTPQDARPIPTVLPAGDAANGEVLFTSRIGNQVECSSCHSLDGSRGTGPSLLGYGEVAGRRRSGMSAQEYTVRSIVQPGDVVVPGYSNIMPSNFGQHLSDQDLADLVAYLLSQ